MDILGKKMPVEQFIMVENSAGEELFKNLDDVIELKIRREYVELISLIAQDKLDILIARLTNQVFKGEEDQLFIECAIEETKEIIEYFNQAYES